MEYKIDPRYEDLMFGDKQDPCLNVGRSVLLASGEGWQVRVSAVGEIRATWTDPRTGSEFEDYEIFERYLTDDNMVFKEQEAGRLVFENNNWYEIELYDTSHADETPRYVDILTNDIAYSFSEAYDRFMEYVEDPNWYEDLQSLLTQG